jgi:cell division transport system permease protein
MSSITYMLSEAFRNMGRNALVVLGAILAVFVSLFLTFGTLMFGEVVRVNTVQWSDDVRVEAFLDDDLNLEAISNLQTTIGGWDDVAGIEFISKTQAREIALDLFSEDPAVISVLEENPDLLPASFRIRPVNLGDYDTITARLEGTLGVSDVASAGDAVDRIVALRDGLQVFSWGLAVLLGVAAVALIANTIHMAIYARREEIEIMKLVGASNWYVRTPFLLEGMLEGLFGALVAVGLALAAYRFGISELQELPEYISLTIEDSFLWTRGIQMLIFGVAVGAIGSSISLAVHRYIRT